MSRPTIPPYSQALLLVSNPATAAPNAVLSQRLPGILGIISAATKAVAVPAPIILTADSIVKESLLLRCSPFASAAALALCCPKTPKTRRVRNLTKLAKGICRRQGISRSSHSFASFVFQPLLVPRLGAIQPLPAPSLPATSRARRGLLGRRFLHRLRSGVSWHPLRLRRNFRKRPHMPIGEGEYSSPPAMRQFGI